MAVGSKPELTSARVGIDSSLDECIVAFEEQKARLAEAESRGERCAPYAEELCRLSRLIVFEVDWHREFPQERRSEIEQSLRSAIAMLDEAFVRLEEDAVRLHSSHISQRLRLLMQ